MTIFLLFTLLCIVTPAAAAAEKLQPCPAGIDSATCSSPQVSTEDPHVKTADYHDELEAEVSRNVERKLAKERRERAETAEAVKAKFASVVDKIDENGMAVVKSSTRSVTETLTPKRLLDITAVVADFADRAVGRFDDYARLHDKSVGKFSEFALRRPFSVETISPVLNSEKYEYLHKASLWNGIANAYFTRHFNQSKVTKSLITATIVMPKALTSQWNLTEAWTSRRLDDDKQWNRVPRGMLVVIVPLDDTTDSSEQLELLFGDGESLFPQIAVGEVLLLGPDPLFDDESSVPSGVVTYEDLQEFHGQQSAGKQASQEREVVKSAAATFMEEGMVMLQGATAGLSLDEAKHATEKIEEFSNRALQRYMYYFYTAAKRNKTDDEVLGHFYDIGFRHRGRVEVVPPKLNTNGFRSKLKQKLLYRLVDELFNGSFVMGPIVGKISFPKEMCEPWREWATEWLDGFDTVAESPRQHWFRREKGFTNSDDKTRERRRDRVSGVIVTIPLLGWQGGEVEFMAQSQRDKVAGQFHVWHAPENPAAGRRLVNISMGAGDALFTDSRLLHRPTVNSGATPVPTLELFFAKSDAALERITMLGTSWLVPKKEYQKAVAEQEELENAAEDVSSGSSVSDAQLGNSMPDESDVDGYEAYISRQEEALKRVFDTAKDIMSEKLSQERQRHFEQLAELQLMKGEQTGEQERIRSDTSVMMVVGE
ncbi:hypothetical protein FOL46_007773 [Perkinsus olseni]|uniref:Uncharacterized protein n=1 Tax=Perkinsus olseni TaxID=32597 RepID=A0A7J6LBM4_PEROL|nr:hypothetical protein FOL46_007773 [Perkinsus olseni]